VSRPRRRPRAARGPAARAGQASRDRQILPRPRRPQARPQASGLLASLVPHAVMSAGGLDEAVVAVVAVADQVASARLGVDEEQERPSVASSRVVASRTDRRGAGILLTVIDRPSGPSRRERRSAVITTSSPPCCLSRQLSTPTGRRSWRVHPRVVAQQRGASGSHSLAAARRDRHRIGERGGPGQNHRTARLS
jgi:hypothetical protein